MITDWRLAEALAIQKLHGSDAASWTAGRLGALLTAGDAAGVDGLAAGRGCDPVDPRGTAAVA